MLNFGIKAFWYTNILFYISPLQKVMGGIRIIIIWLLSQSTGPWNADHSSDDNLISLPFTPMKISLYPEAEINLKIWLQSPGYNDKKVNHYVNNHSRDKSINILSIETFRRKGMDLYVWEGDRVRWLPQNILLFLSIFLSLLS